MLGKSIGAVRVIQFRALNNLRNLMREDELGRACASHAPAEPAPANVASAPYCLPRHRPDRPCFALA